MRHTHVCSVLDNTWRNDSSLIYIELKMHKKRADEKCQMKKMLIVKKTNSTKQKHVFVRAKDEIEKKRGRGKDFCAKIMNSDTIYREQTNKK